MGKHASMDVGLVWVTGTRNALRVKHSLPLCKQLQVCIVLACVDSHCFQPPATPVSQVVPVPIADWMIDDSINIQSKACPSFVPLVLICPL